MKFRIIRTSDTRDDQAQEMNFETLSELTAFLDFIEEEIIISPLYIKEFEEVVYQLEIYDDYREMI